jgi:hypothetical protein
LKYCSLRFLRLKNWASRNSKEYPFHFHFGFQVYKLIYWILLNRIEQVKSYV